MTPTPTTKHVCVWSGKRGGFGALVPTMKAIQEHPALELSVVVTDQHLYDRFGRTISEVEAQFEVAAAIDMEQQGDTNLDRARAVGVCLTKASEVLDELRPDVLLVIGDRGEVFAACIAAHNLGIAIAHVQGGDVSGSLDEPVRHAITKLAHVHFPSTKASADRILRMGEEPWRVHVVGDTHIDQILLGARPPERELRARYQIGEDEPFLLVLQHSDSTTPDRSAEQMAETVAAVRAIGHRALFIYPCSDQGFEGILSEIQKLEGEAGFSIHTNVPAPDFIGLQSLAECLVGNSSAGLIEAPYLGLPAINVGDRQIGREHTDNVIHAPYERDAIADAIRKALRDEGFRKRCRELTPPFGDGKTHQRITRVLAELPMGPRLLLKKMTH